MAFATINQFTVAVHTKHPPTDDEWDEYLTAHAPYFERGVSMRFLVLTDGGAPTAIQRMRMNDLVADWTRRNPDCIRTAIITRSAFVRGVVTAIGWFRPIARAFGPDHLEQALSYLEVPPVHVQEIEQIIPKLKAKLVEEAKS